VQFGKQLRNGVVLAAIGNGNGANGNGAAAAGVVCVQQSNCCAYSTWLVVQVAHIFCIYTSVTV
jgi:hypothetical protein